MLLEMMLFKRPDELKLSGPLYLTPLRKPIDQICWHSHWESKWKWQTVHKSYSVRKVTVQKLKKDGLSSCEITAIMGHKTEESLKDYDAIDRDDHSRLSTCNLVIERY